MAPFDLFSPTEKREDREETFTWIQPWHSPIKREKQKMTLKLSETRHFFFFLFCSRWKVPLITSVFFFISLFVGYILQMLSSSQQIKFCFYAGCMDFYLLQVQSRLMLVLKIFISSATAKLNSNVCRTEEGPIHEENAFKP
jgi:hypothetical protein